MSFDEISDLSSELSDAPSSPEIPPSFYSTPPPSQDDSAAAHPREDMPPARKRRKLERKERTTRHLDLDATWTIDDDPALDLMLKSLRKRQKIVVIAGAGISVSAGIPDFRSSKGLFRTLRNEHKLKASGKQLFDASVYKDNSSTASFHDMVRSLSDLSAKAQPTLFHRLLARLAKEDRLLRLYTQNVDGLELTLPPLKTQIPLNHKGPWPRTIQLHGGLEKMVCHKCKHISPFNPELFNGPVPPSCPECEERDSVRTTHAGKRSHGVGKLRPRMVLYNEQNPDEDAIGAVVASDLRARPDAVIIVGTTLKIPPVRRIVKEMCLTARGRQNGITMLINKEPLTLGKDLEDCFDVVVEGTSDEVARLVNLKEWDDDSQDIIEECTLSDVERAKARSGNVRVTIETPKKTMTSSSLMANGIITPKMNMTRTLMANGIMTPPISMDEESLDESKTKDAIKKQLKNPATHGRSIAEVLGQNTGIRVKQQRKSNPRSMVKAVTKNKSTTRPSKKSQSQSTRKQKGQSKIAGKASKASDHMPAEIKSEPEWHAATVGISSADSKPPVSAFTINNTLGPIPLQATIPNRPPMFPGLRWSFPAHFNRRHSSESAESMESSVCVDTREARRETIRPDGKPPNGMEALLD